MFKSRWLRLTSITGLTLAALVIGLLIFREIHIHSGARPWGFTFGRCVNATTADVIVYGPRMSHDTPFDNSMYALAPGTATPLGFDCDGFYIPLGGQFHDAEADMMRDGPLVVKIFDLSFVHLTGGVQEDGYRVGVKKGRHLVYDKSDLAEVAGNWAVPDWNVETFLHEARGLEQP